MHWAPTDELYHHGILGMRWGHKNGPPYPLDEGDHSQSEKKAGWKSSLSAEQKAGIKKALVIGGVAVAGIGAAYVITHPEVLKYAQAGKQIVAYHADDLIGDVPKVKDTVKSAFKKLDSKSIPKSVSDAFSDLTNNPLKKADNVDINMDEIAKYLLH